jgi:hypothetical protein
MDLLVIAKRVNEMKGPMRDDMVELADANLGTTALTGESE